MRKLSWMEANQLVGPIRPLTLSERQDRFVHNGRLDPRCAEYMVMAAELVLENNRLRRQLINAGIEIAPKAKIVVRELEQPPESDGIEYPAMVEPLSRDQLVRVKIRPKDRDQQKYGYDAAS